MSSLRWTLLTFVLLNVLPGCSSSSWKRDSIYSGHPVFLYREYKLEDEQRVPLGFAHPGNLSQEEVHLVLSRMQYETRKFLWSAPTRHNVFTLEEVEKLSEPLSLALKSVTPDERVRFLTTRGNLASIVTGIPGVSGVAFETPNGNFNIAFDAIDEGINEGDGTPEDVFFPYDPTEETYQHGLVPLVGARLHQNPEDGTIHSRWMEIPLNKLVMAVASEEPPPQTKAQKDGRYESLRDRLKALKRLRDDGALTPEEYDKEYEKVMKELAR